MEQLRSGIELRPPPNSLRYQPSALNLNSFRHVFSWHSASLVVVLVVQILLLSLQVQPAQSAALFASRRGNDSFITNNITDALIHLARDVNDSSVFASLEEIDSEAVIDLPPSLLKEEEDEEDEVEHKGDVSTSRWMTGPWGSCDVPCGEGVQKRVVVCKSVESSANLANSSSLVLLNTTSANNSKAVVDDYLPDDACILSLKPLEVRPCNTTAATCTGIQWFETDWSKCEGCGDERQRHREILCLTKHGQIIDASFCAHLMRAPRAIKKCLWNEELREGECIELVAEMQQIRMLRQLEPTEAAAVTVGVETTTTASNDNETTTEDMSTTTEAGNDTTTVEMEEVTANITSTTEETTTETTTELSTTETTVETTTMDDETTTMEDEVTASGNDTMEEVDEDEELLLAGNATAATAGNATAQAGKTTPKTGAAAAVKKVTKKPSKKATTKKPSKKATTKKPEKKKPELPKGTWRVGSWKGCLGHCEGNATRTVECVARERGERKAVPVNESRCTEDEPDDETPCEETETCKPKWFIGPWEPCTASCGGGERQRQVLCIKGFMNITDDSECPGDEPATEEPCNLTSCDESENNHTLYTDRNCMSTGYGCCQDGVTPARGPYQSGCENVINCNQTEFGCCQDGVTVALGEDDEGCDLKEWETRCDEAEFGCCQDGRTVATGPSFAGCPESDCANTYYGCCPDGVAAAQSANYDGCPFRDAQRAQVCSQPKEPGSGQSFEVRWYYDADYGDCNRFWFGGNQQEANGNNFMSEALCRQLCVSPQGLEKCYLPKIRGPCDLNSPAWYYDPGMQSCQQFYYGGCLGNDNRFESMEQCRSECVVTQISDVCQQPVDAGNCNQQIERYYYDASTQRCQRFMYTGCSGNGNRFRDDRACYEKCLSRGGSSGAYYPSVVGSVDAYAGWQPQRERSNAQACQYPRSEGTGSGYHVLWYYDTQYQECLQFVFTGEGGNANQFQSEQECQTTCTPPRPTVEGVVMPAPAYPPAAYPDRLNDQFRNNGGGANGGGGRCSAPPDAGQCDTYEIFWHFDAAEGVCKQFYYGGCGGNANRYESQESCDGNCTRAMDPCSLPKVAGPCQGDYEKYYFDASSRQCKPFQFGGCAGNANNFDTVAQCQVSCMGMYAQGGGQSQQIVGLYQRPSYPPHDEALDNGVEQVTGELRPVVISGESGSATSGIAGSGAPVDSSDPYYAICSLDVDPGPENGCGDVSSVERFYYDITSGECRQFQYRGCGGNQNHFESQAQCQDFCQRYGTRRCPSRDCGQLACSAGFERDRNGCILCKCKDACQEVRCGQGEVCEGGVCMPGTRPDKAKKVGSCPNIGIESQGECEAACFSDESCPGSQKCCYNGCGYQCLDAANRAEDEGVPSGVYAAYIQPGQDVVYGEPGQSVQLSCDAQGNPLPTVTWEKDGRSIRTGGRTERHRQLPNNNLIIESVQQADAGTYMCRANNGLGPSVARPIRLQVEGTSSPVLRIPGDQVETVYKKMGSSLSLRCEAFGIPEPMIRWLRQGVEITNETQQHVRKTSDNRLVIDEITNDDQDAFLCIAENNVHQAAQKQYVLRVHEPVTISRIEDDKSQRISTDIRDGVKRKPGDRLALHCYANGVPEPKIKWYKGQRQIQSGTNFMDMGNGTLVVQQLSQADAGKYECQANNDITNAKRDVWVRVSDTSLPQDCIDQEFYANCALVVQANLCDNNYYKQFCCKSCTEAGQLPA